MQVVAHEDDDLIFMSPDLDRTISTGATTVTVYVTAGEFGSDNRGDRARIRQRGIQNAYAAMAGVEDGDDDTQNEWDRAAIAVPGDRFVERYSLLAKPCVALVFMNLPDAGLSSLDANPADAVFTVVPTDGAVSASYRYQRADVVSVLGGPAGSASAKGAALSGRRARPAGTGLL
jgi:hypothetical protein